MALDLFIDLDAKAFVAGISTTAALPSLEFFYGDTVNINLQFLKKTGSAQNPYKILDYSDKSVVMSIGTAGAGAAITQNSWNNSAISGGSVSVTSPGSSTSSAVQSINLQGTKGNFTLTIPARSGSFTPGATTFNTPIPHGLIVGNSITLNYTGGVITSLSADSTNNQTLIVASTPSAKSFTIKDDSGKIYGPKTSGDVSGFVGEWSIPSATTSGIDVSATSADVQSSIAALVGSGNVVVGGSNGVYSIQFVNALANVAIDQMTISTSIASSPYKNSSLSLFGTALQHAIAAGGILMEATIVQDGFMTTLAQIPVSILGSVQHGNGTYSTNVGDNTKVPFPAMILGADYTFGILPRDGITKQPLDLTNASLVVTIHTDPFGPQIASMNVSMPNILGNSIICILPAPQTSGISVASNNSTFWIKMLLSNPDSSVVNLGSGFVHVNPA